ncbi:hypothetical protein EDC01DRAFT_164105 [Geopyxis carbonaria]|nr:hypothetical protein EDC01DRAFT_164105 [Geopyxis carbonaria]
MNLPPATGSMADTAAAAAAAMPNSSRVPVIAGGGKFSEHSVDQHEAVPSLSSTTRRTARVDFGGQRNSLSSRVPVQSLATRHSHSDSHQLSETTAVPTIHRQTPRSPALHIPVARSSLNSASVFETANSLGRSRNTVVAPSRAGNGPSNTKLAHTVEDDPPTLSSLNSANESEDLGRIRKILQYSDVPVPANKNPVPDDASPTERSRKFKERRLADQEKRDQQRLEAAQRSRFNSFGYPESNMIRRRTATGEEMVGTDDDYNERNMPSSPPFGTDSPLYTPERPTSAASMRSDILMQRGSVSSLRDFERSPGSRRNSTATIEEGGKEKVKDKTKRRISTLFRRSSAGKEKTGDDADWLGAAAVGSPSPEQKEKTGFRSLLSRSASNKLQDGLPFQTVQKRVDERSTRITPTSNKEPRDNTRPSSAASRRAFGDGLANRQSRLPTPSPSASRPTSSNDHRRTFSTVSSHSERRPLIRSPSSVSLKSRTSDPSSPSASLYQSEFTRSREPLRSRRETTPGSVSNIPKPVVSRKETQLERNGDLEKPPPASLRRADSAPTEPTEYQNPNGVAVGSVSSKPEALPKVPEKEIVKKKIDPEIAEKVSPTPPRPRMNRGNSVDSFLGRKTGGIANTPPTPPSEMDPPGMVSNLRSPTLSDFDELNDSRVNPGGQQNESSPLLYRSTGRPKPPKTALEDDDSGDELESLMRSEQDYRSLLNPTTNDEDDTFMLLGGSRQYEPSPVPVRPRQDAIAGDRTKARERAANDKLMNRLKTLHLELRSARRGIDYIERRLNGAGSSDEGEWVDDDDSDNVAKRIRSEESKQRRKMEAIESSMAAMAARTKTPPGFSTTTKCLIIFGQLAMVWFLLELAMFYRNFPPSASPVPIEFATIPTFGTWTADTVYELVGGIVSSVLWIPQALMWCGSQLWWALSVVFAGLSSVAVQAWQAKTSSTTVSVSSFDSAPSAMPLGSDQILH